MRYRLEKLGPRTARWVFVTIVTIVAGLILSSANLIGVAQYPLKEVTWTFDRLDRIGAGLSWWHEAKFVAEFLHELIIHPLPHAHGAIALHIGMPAHRTRARAGPANIPT